MQNEANLVPGRGGGTKPIYGHFFRHEPTPSRPVLLETSNVAPPANERRLFDFRVAGGLGGPWVRDREVIEKTGQILYWVA